MNTSTMPSYACNLNADLLHQQRVAQSLAVTMRLSNMTGKRAARTLGVDKATVSRWVNGKVSSPLSVALGCIEKMCAAKAYPISLLTEALAKHWEAALKDWSMSDLTRRKRELRAEVQRAMAAVQEFMLADAAGLPVDAAAYDEARHEAMTRLMELHVVEHEIRLPGRN